VAYIVDGNNVMGQTPGWHRDKPGARRRLIEQLAEFARLKKARITVVFDGEPDHNQPDGSAYRGVKILYADKGSNADARIERLVESARDVRGLTVVTSDRALAFIVRARGANVIRSGVFRHRIERAMAAAPIVEDGEQIEVDDVNAWMRYFGAMPEDDEEC